MSDLVGRILLAARAHFYANELAPALRILDEAVSERPDTPLLLRHRGELRIVARDFAGALEDLRRATNLLENAPDLVEFYKAEVLEDVGLILRGREPRYADSAIVATEDSVRAFSGIYKSTLKFNAWYHLALAHYLRGEFGEAADGFSRAMQLAFDDDMQVAAGDWCYMSSRRLGDTARATAVLRRLDRQMRLHAPNYHSRVQLYLGRADAADLLAAAPPGRATATVGYGVGNWYLYNGDPEAASAAFRRVLDQRDTFAFGHIAAEVEVARAGVKGW